MRVIDKIVELTGPDSQTCQTVGGARESPEEASSPSPSVGRDDDNTLLGARSLATRESNDLL